MVGRGDARRPHPVRRLLQEAVAQLPGAVLQGRANLPGIGRRVSAAAGQGDALCPAPACDKALVPVRRGAEMVVEVGGVDLEAPLPPHLPQQMEQGHGVPPPGHGAENQPARGQHVPLFRECLNVHHIVWILISSFLL